MRESRERGSGWEQRWRQPRWWKTTARNGQGSYHRFGQERQRRDFGYGGSWRVSRQHYDLPPRRRLETNHASQSSRPWAGNFRQQQRRRVAPRQFSRPGAVSTRYDQQKQPGILHDQRQPGILHDQRHTTMKQQSSSRDCNDFKMQRELFSVYVDGLSDRITLLKLRSYFGKAGRVRDVYIQFKKKFQRRFRYGFVRFQKEEEALTAIRILNGSCFEGNYLVVKKAKTKQALNNVKTEAQERQQPKEQRKVWRRKSQQSKQPSDNIAIPKEESASVQPQEDAVACRLSLSASDLDNFWYQRCARAMTLESKPVDIIQDELAQIGMYNFRFIPLGANEVLLEFQDKEEMESTLAECRFFLEQKLTELRPCTLLTYGVAHLVWIRLWQVPLGLWSEPFFTAVGNRLGSFVSLDTATEMRHRADFARILVRTHHPLLHCFTMAVDVEGTAFIILVEKDDGAYDYGKVECMPSTPVKIYNSEDDVQSYDDSENKEDEDVDETHAPILFSEKDYESAVDVASDEEDELFRDENLEGLHVIQDEDFLTLNDEARENPLSGGGLGFQGSSPATVSDEEERPETVCVDDAAKNSNSNGITEAINFREEIKEQFQVLLDSGYTLPEIEEWRKKSNAATIMINAHKICYNDFQNHDINANNNLAVSGFSFNSKDLNQKYCWPLFSTYWDPQNILQQQVSGTCLANGFLRHNNLLSLTSFPASTTSGSQKQVNACREIFVHTSPHQIVRFTHPTSPIFPVEGVNIEAQTLQTPLPLEHAEPVTLTPYNSPNTNSSKKGRPKGSKNKPLAVPHDFLEPVTGEDGVTTRAQRAWLVGKQLGLKPRGSEALMIRGLEAQIRENHPHLN